MTKVEGRRIEKGQENGGNDSLNSYHCTVSKQRNPAHINTPDWLKNKPDGVRSSGLDRGKGSHIWVV
jgi:hypothetical protein